MIEHKCMTLETVKRDRIINAAMREFCNGYKKASTDNIVREAGISKGLLFHYFETKEKLYEFIIQYAFEVAEAEYFNLINVKQRDLLESLWQMTLLKRDLSYRYPELFMFLAKAYLYVKDGPADAFVLRFKAMQEKMVGEIYHNFDASLFKEGIDPHKAANILWWTLTGYAETQVSAEKSAEDYQKEYDRYLLEIKEYFDIFRRCFYK